MYHVVSFMKDYHPQILNSIIEFMAAYVEMETELIENGYEKVVKKNLEKISAKDGPKENSYRKWVMSFDIDCEKNVNNLLATMENKKTTKSNPISY